MKILTSLLFGALGWTLAGPIGAVIGGILGYKLGPAIDRIGSDDSDSQAQPGAENNSGQAYGRDAKSTAKADFAVSLMVLVAAVMKADGKVTKTELNEVKHFLSNHFEEDEAKAALQILKSVLQRDYDIRPVCNQIRDNLNYSSRLELLHLLFKVSAADGVMTKSEMDLIREMAYHLGINSLDFRSIYAAYSSYSRNQRSDGSEGQKRTASSSKMSLQTAYTILQIDENASEQDVKKAYRKMAMKYHPDKVNNLGEEVKKSASEKFKAVNEAYNVIKDHKGYK